MIGLVDRPGRHFNFWMDWIDSLGATGFFIWKEVEPAPIWFELEEYLEARREVELPDVI